MSTRASQARPGRASSRDGTAIAYDVRGDGPPIILVDGAFCSRAFGPMGKLAPLLAPMFEVISYDRRGRNQSGNTPPYALQREIDDLHALIDVAGGEAFLYGTSSGAALAMRAAASHQGVKKLVMYEPPIVIEGSPEPVPPDRYAEITALVEAGHVAQATKAFLRMVGAPAFAVWMMPLIPGVWPKLLAAAPTLPHDFATLGDTGAHKPLPDELVRVMDQVRIPTLVGVGSKSPGWMQHTVKTLANAISDAELRTIPGQTHVISEKAIAPVLIDFFAA
jgi:pimeloyl-ACP methyl ester carboxylesterase